MIKLLKFFFPMTMADYANEVRVAYCEYLDKAGAFTVPKANSLYWNTVTSGASTVSSEEYYKKYLKEL